MGTSNSQNFIKRMQRGREDALEWAYDRYVPFVKSIVYNVLIKFNDSGAVEECINDVFVSAWNNCSKFSGDESKFKNWIGAIAKFKAIDYYRNLSKKTEDELNDDEISKEDSLEDEIINSENKREIIELLNNLEEVDRKIFIMKYFLGMSAEEIGRKLKITKMAVNGRLYRNKRKLKKKAIELNIGGNLA